MMFYTSGYNTVLSRGIWGSVYLERVLSDEFLLTLNEWHSVSWDSLSKNLYRSASNNVGVIYTPARWLTLESGLIGSRYLTEKADGAQSYTTYSSQGFMKATTTTDLLYSYYHMKYGKERSATSVPDGKWSTDEINKGDAIVKLRIKPCTLGVYHHLNRHSTWTDGGDTLEMTISRIPFLKGHLLSGAEFGRRRATGSSDYLELGSKFWVKDTFRITPNAGISLDGSYLWDTLTNNLSENYTYSEQDLDLSARLSYAPFERTSVQLEFANEKSLHDQVDNYYDEESFEHSFAGKISHSFYRRPEQAKSLWNRNVNMVSPGSIYFSHSLSLERVSTPDSLNALDRDVFTERTSLSTTFRPSGHCYTYFTLSHYIQRTHYTDTLNTSYAASSHERKSSYASWTVDIEFPGYVDIWNLANLSFDWVEYYNDSTSNRADRIWRDEIAITLFPEAVFQPGAQINWERYENWRMTSGELTRTGLEDVVEQTYSLSFVRNRKEETPKYYWQPYQEREWLQITGFAGISMKITPVETQSFWQESRFAGIESYIRPWPYLSINGRIKFTRSNYEAPFEASCFISSSF